MGLRPGHVLRLGWQGQGLVISLSLFALAQQQRVELARWASCSVSLADACIAAVCLVAACSETLNGLVGWCRWCCVHSGAADFDFDEKFDFVVKCSELRTSFR